MAVSMLLKLCTPVSSLVKWNNKKYEITELKVNEIIYEKHLGQCLATSECSIHVNCCHILSVEGWEYRNE